MHPFLPSEGLELNWSLLEPHPTSGPFYLALGCPLPRSGGGKSEQVAQSLREFSATNQGKELGLLNGEDGLGDRL